MKINKFLPFALIFFFINPVALPYGLTYTAILSPFFYFWILLKKKVEPLTAFVAILSPFIIAHLLSGVHLKDYIVSFLNLTCVYIFCVAFYFFLKTSHTTELIYKRILYINFFLCLIAIPVFFTSYYNIFWIEQFLTGGIDNFRRLKMFTYEASHYATLFTPICLYFLLQILLIKNSIPTLKLIAFLALPFLLSFSLGVVSCILLSLFLLFLFYGQTFLRKKRNLLAIASSIVFVFLCMIVCYIFFPDNVLFVRIQNIFTGHDSSGKGRTFEAFYLAQKIIERKSLLWGIGLGQLKFDGADIIRNFYAYDANYRITIPNAAAETLAIFGWIGLILRISIQLFLFVVTKVWTNYYRLVLFFFIFIYQFTGGFITNIIEYVIWIIAFTKCFPEFDVRLKSETLKAEFRTNV